MTNYNKFYGKASPPLTSLLRSYWRTRRYIFLVPAALSLWSFFLLISHFTSIDGKFDIPISINCELKCLFHLKTNPSMQPITQIDPEFTLESRFHPDNEISTATLEKNPTPYKPIILSPLPKLADVYIWPPNIRKPLCLPKIFVYPDSAKMGEFQVTEAPHVGTTHIAEEILLSELRNKDSAVYKNYVTENPDEADFFYIPFLGSKYLADCWVTRGADGDCDIDEKYAEPMMNHVLQDYPYWNRTYGKDHIMAHPMSSTSLYYKSKDRMQNATFLTTVGDKRVVFNIDGRSRRLHDIVIPSATPLLNLVNVDPAEHLTVDGQPKTGSRDIFLLYGGRYDDVKPTDEYSAGICSLLFNGLDIQPDYKIAKGWSNTEYTELLTKSKYGFAPQGYTLDSTLIWDYIAFGVVPVVIADGIIEPFEDDIFWDSFIVRIPRHDAHKMDVILRSMSAQEYELKRQAVWNHGRQALLGHDAWHYIVRDLCRKGRLEGKKTIDREHHEQLDIDAALV